MADETILTLYRAGGAQVRFVIVFTVAFTFFMAIFSFATEDDGFSYRKAESGYETVLNGRAITLSGVNFYWETGRVGGYIFYRPGGRDFAISCIRCEIKWREVRAQIGEVDYVTLPDGSRVATAIRLKSGHILMSRATAVAAMRYIRDRQHDLLVSQSARDDRTARGLVFSTFFALVFTATYALQRMKDRRTRRREARG